MRRPIRNLRSLLLATTIATIGIATIGIAPASGQDMPVGGVVSAGSATIQGSGATTTIQQASDRAVIDWQRFSIGAGGTVAIQQPSATSALLNRVKGSEMSRIAGNLTANGQVFLINPNGIVVDQTGKVQARGGFVASTLDIANDDFMAGKLDFRGQGTGVVANRGYIAGGAVALLGSQVANDGVIVSSLGRVAMGSAKQATLDLNGDGLLQVAIPSDFTGPDGAAFVTNSGLIDAAGGTVMLKVATAREIVRQTINMAGIIRATSVSQAGGSVVLDGGNGAVGIAGTIDVSGQSGGQSGGRIDITGGDVALTGAMLTAAGIGNGGLIRVGGAFQGGNASLATDAALADTFTTRFGAPGALNAARTTTIDAASTLDASGGVLGGAVVAWSTDRTRQAGTVTASGATGGMGGGAIELSSKGTLTTDLSRVTTGRGGTLLLDPKDISIDNASVGGIKTLMDGGTDVFLRASNDINWGADLSVGLAADPGDLSLSAGRSVSISGFLTLNNANLTVVANDTLANGVVDADRDPGAGEIDALNANISGGIGSGASGGIISLKVANGAGVTNAQAGGMRLTPITARSIAIDAGSSTVSMFDYGGGINPAFLTAVDGVTINGAIRVQASAGLTVSGRTVNWLSEATSILSASSPATRIRFIENSVLTRYGVLNGGSTGGGGGGGGGGEGGEGGGGGGGGAVTDTTRLALGAGGATPAYSAVYGNAYGAFTPLRVVSGALRSGDTLGTILADGSVTATGPAAGSGVGDYAVTTSAAAGFGFAAGVAGYFVDLRAATDTLRITPKALTPTVAAGAYSYGTPASVASLAGLVGSDSVGLAATVPGLGTQALTAAGSGYAFAPNLAAGQRSFTLTGLTGTASANYTLNLGGTISAALDIARKSLVYAGTSATSTYGTLNAARFDLTGALAGDDVSIGVAGVSRNGVTSTLTATTNVGTYATVASALSGTAAGNYALDTANSSAGSAIITAKTVSYVTTDTNSTYGTLAAITAPTLNGVIAGDGVGAIATLNDGAVAFDARTAAGNYNITAALTGSGAGNYVLSGPVGAPGVLRVGRLGLGVTLADGSMVYSSAVPDLATLSGVLAGDDVRPVATIDNSLQPGTLDVGTYQYQLSGIGGGAANNYVLALPTVRTATLTVTPKPITYSINSLTTTYGNFGTFTLELVNPSQFALTAPIVISNTATGVSAPFDPNARLPVGTYALSAGALSGINATNFMIATSGNQPGALVITPKPITYAASSTSSTYGDTPQMPFVGLVGAFSSDAVSANLAILSGTSAITLTDRTNAGSYRVTASGLSGAAAGNYVLSGGTDGVLTIAQRRLGYTLQGAFVTYGQLAAPTTVFSGLLAGDSVTPIYMANGAELTNALNVGTYRVSLDGLRGPSGGNYFLAPTSGTTADLVISPARLSYTMADATSVYGDSLKFSPLIWSGLQFGDAGPAATVFLANSRAFTNVFAGTYTPEVDTSVSGNYILDTAASNPGKYVITRRPISLESFANAGAFGLSYGLKADQITGLVRVGNVVDGDSVRFTATPQGLTNSTGGYVNAGSYVLKTAASVGDLSGANYIVASVTDGLFTVAPRFLGTAGGVPLQSTYGTLATLVGTTATPFAGDIVNFGGLTLYNDAGPVNYVATTAPGSYAIRAASLTGADARNYLIDSGNAGSLTILPKALAFRAESRTATYGTLLDLGTAPLTGIVGSDQVIATNRVVGYTDRSNAGTLQFSVPTLSGASAGNYTLDERASFAGVLTIAPRGLSVTYLNSAPTTWTYGALQDPATFLQLNGILAGDTVNAMAFGVLTGTAAGNPLALGSVYAVDSVLNAGSYRVSAMNGNGQAELTGASARNYALAAGAATNGATSFTVTPRTIGGALTLPATAVYGDAPAITVGFTNQVSGATVAYRVDASLGTTSRTLGQAAALPANLAVGNQRLDVALSGLDSYNYRLATPVSGQIAITPKAVTIDSLANSATYATTTGALFGINGMVAGDDVAPLVSLGGGTATRAASVTGGFGIGLVTTDVGGYSTGIAALTGAAAGNYVLTPYTGGITITPKTITYTSDGFSAQYGGLTLPTCASGCEMSGRDNGLAMGKVTLNDILPADINLLQIESYLSFDGRSNASSYTRTTVPGTYLQIAQTLGGSKARNYVVANEGNRAGLVFILPGWVKATVSGGGRLYTNASLGKYISLDTPGVVTVQRSTNLNDQARGNAFLANDQVNVLTALVDAKGNIVDGASNLAVGSYTINPLALTGPNAANYRLVPEGPNGSTAGIFTVSDQSVFNFSFLGSSPTGYYVPPAISKPTVAPATTTQSTTTTSSTTATATTAGLTATAEAGAAGTISITQTNADGSSLTGSAGGSVGATANFGPTGGTATVSLSGNVSLIIKQGPVTINYGAYADVSGKVEVSLKDLTIAAGGEAMVGLQQGVTVGGNLGNGMTGGAGVQSRVFATANGETSASFKNGANLGTSGFIGVGASTGVSGELSGGGVTGSLGATLYSPGSLYIGAKVETTYADHKMTIGFNLGLSLLIGGLEISPKITFNTEKIEQAGPDFANAWVGLAEKVNGSFCDAGCTAARNKMQADYDAQVRANTLSKKADEANRMMIGGKTPTTEMIQYLQDYPDVAHYAQEEQAAGRSTPATRAITDAIDNYGFLTDRLTTIISQERALASRLATDPTSLTSADLQLAESLRRDEKALVGQAATMFNARVVLKDGQLSFDSVGPRVGYSAPPRPAEGILFKS